jgi:hypothetical protein
MDCYPCRATGTGSALIEPTPALFGHAIHLQYFYLSKLENNILTFYQFVGSNIHPVHVVTFMHNLEKEILYQAHLDSYYLCQERMQF